MRVACIVVAFSTVAGVMGLQTRSSLVSHFAKSNNIPDCSAKEGNQERGVTSVIWISVSLGVAEKY